MNKLRMILAFLLKLHLIKFGSALPNTIKIGKYTFIIHELKGNIYDAGGLFDATDSGKDGGYVSEETAFRL